MNKIITVNNKEYNLSLEYIFGLFEGDGSVTIQLKPNISHKTGRQVILIFEIHQHVIDMDLLKAISIYLNCGKVEIGRKVGSKETWVYRLRISLQTEILNILLPILQSQSMMLKKRSHDLNLFIKSCLIVQEKNHIHDEGQAIISKYSSKLSSKLSVEDKTKFKDIKININPNRILGFTDAEGHFSFMIIPSRKNDNEIYVNFNFLISQEKSEIKFLNELTKFFGCGHVFTLKKGGGVFYVHNKQDLQEKIIPFFEEHKLQTIKKFSFLRFKRALEICKSNKYLLENHIQELKNILLDQTGKRPKK